MNSEELRELRSLEGERKMSQVAIQGYQQQTAIKLRGLMGQDIKDVLTGKKKVKMSFWQKLNYKIKNMFLKLGGGYGETV